MKFNTAIPISTVKLECHKNCKQTTLHSVCLPVQPLRTPVMAQMLYKVETLPETQQNQKRLSQYAGVEKILKS